MSVKYCFECERYHADDQPHKADNRAEEKREARARLLEDIQPGTEIHTILRHVSRSGMQREISLVTVDKAGRLIHLDYWAAKLAGWKIGKHGGIVAGGCGMDMGFHLVYHLGLALWPNGTPKPHGRRNGEADSNGGYALKHHWL